MYSIKENLVTGKTVLSNVLEFLDAACLAVVSGFAIYSGYQRRTEFMFALLLLSGIAIAIQAFVLLVKHFNYSK